MEQLELCPSNPKRRVSKTTILNSSGKKPAPSEPASCVRGIRSNTISRFLNDWRCNPTLRRFLKCLSLPGYAGGECTTKEVTMGDGELLDHGCGAWVVFPAYLPSTSTSATYVSNGSGMERGATFSIEMESQLMT